MKEDLIYENQVLFSMQLKGEVCLLATTGKKKTSEWRKIYEDDPVTYRIGMRIEEVMVFETWYGKTGYYVCPRCKITMDREFTSFCDRCGQKLDWRGYRKAKVIYPGPR